MPSNTQRILDFGDNSVFIEADPEERISSSFWLRIGRTEQAQGRPLRLTVPQARILGWALLVHADGVDERQKERSYPRRMGKCG